MKLWPCSLVKEIATFAYLMLTFNGTPKMPRGCSVAPGVSTLVRRQTLYQHQRATPPPSHWTLPTVVTPLLTVLGTQETARLAASWPARSRRDGDQLGLGRAHNSSRITASTHVPFDSSFLVELRLKFLHQEARSRFDGGELEGTGSDEVAGNSTGSRPGCDLPVTMVIREAQRRVEDGGAAFWGKVVM